MSRICTALALCALPCAPLSAQGLPALDSDDARIAYAIGLRIGFDVLEDIRRHREDLGALDVDALLLGVRDHVEGVVPHVSDDFLTQTLSRRQIDRPALEAATEGAQLAATTAFLTGNGGREDVITTASGLQYRVLTEGEGKTFKLGQTFDLRVRSFRSDGTEYGSRRASLMTVQGLQEGYMEAFQLMSPHAAFEVWIPPHLGRKGTQRANSDLARFEVAHHIFEAFELLE